jgi:hypothetical protein
MSSANASLGFLLIGWARCDLLDIVVDCWLQIDLLLWIGMIRVTVPWTGWLFSLLNPAIVAIVVKPECHVNHAITFHCCHCLSLLVALSSAPPFSSPCHSQRCTSPTYPNAIRSRLLCWLNFWLVMLWSQEKGKERYIDNEITNHTKNTVEE